MMRNFVLWGKTLRHAAQSHIPASNKRRVCSAAAKIARVGSICAATVDNSGRRLISMYNNNNNKNKFKLCVHLSNKPVLRRWLKM
jgi:hypothetical protein